MNLDNPGSINPREEDPTEFNSLSQDHGDSNNSLNHEVGHPIMQAYQTHPPVVDGPSSRTPSPMFQNISGSRSARFNNISDGDPSVSSRRQLTLQFVKGMFGAGRGGKSRPKTMLYLLSAASDTDNWQKLHLQNLDVHESKGTSWRVLSSTESTPSSFSVLLGALSQLDSAGGLEEEAEGKLDNNFFYYIL
ncbi:MAG: hypothetical protein NXY57DRAFT_963710 [Lentinula lateritia]|nr:MAG: hypothetical protein NXY57DRAFT_963710 [Lentinula lateritia]